MGISNWLIRKLSNHLMKDRQKQKSYLCDFDRITHEIRPADVLLIEGRNRISAIIRRFTHSPWTHSALYIGRLYDVDDATLRELIHKHYQGKPDAQLVVESILGRGTVISPIEEFQHEHIRICRPSGLAHKDAQKVIAYAVRSIGKEYSVRHLLDIGRFLLGSRLIPWRWKSSLLERKAGEATQEICSAMIAAAFTSIQFPILPLVHEDLDKNIKLIKRNANLFTPSDFDYSPYFDIIKYPLFPMGNLAAYRNLPWQEHLMSNDQAGIVDEKKRGDA